FAASADGLPQAGVANGPHRGRSARNYCAPQGPWARGSQTDIRGGQSKYSDLDGLCKRWESESVPRLENPSTKPITEGKGYRSQGCLFEFEVDPYSQRRKGPAHRRTFR